MNGLPPGLAGWVLADQQRGKKDAQQIGMLGSLAQLQNHVLEQQLLPLKMKQLQAQVAEAETMGNILQRYMNMRSGGPGAQGALAAGAAVGDVGPTVTNAQRIPQANPMQLPPEVELALLHPRLAPLGKVQAEAFKPTDKMRELIARGVQPGSPQWNSELGLHFNQGGAWQVGPDGQLRLASNYAEGMGEIKKAEEGARAAYDLVTIPPTSPNAPPRQVTREQRIQELAPRPSATVTPPVATPPNFPRVSPQVQAQRDAEAAEIRAREGSGGGLPIQAVIPGSQAGNAAGMTPRQEAEVKASVEFLTKTAEGRAKLLNDLNAASMKNPGKIAKLEQIGKLLGDFDGGKLSQTSFEIARLANSVGLKIDPRLSNKEAAEALAKEVALELRDPGAGAGMPGALSDADRQFLVSMTPNMAQTAEGRKTILNSRVALLKREIQVGNMARAYNKKYGTLDDGFFSQLSAWSASNPLFR